MAVMPSCITPDAALQAAAPPGFNLCSRHIVNLTYYSDLLHQPQCNIATNKPGSRTDMSSGKTISMQTCTTASTCGNQYIKHKGTGGGHSDPWHHSSCLQGQVQGS
jgi:hypothetical protein